MRVLILLPLILVTSCALYKAEEATADDRVVVYISKGSTQCQQDGLHPTESERQLKAAGIDVLQTQCGSRTGVAFAAVCGAPTGVIIAHSILRAQAAEAEKLGYLPIGRLVDVDRGTGYRLGSCD